jgi:hypothetical protein
MSLSTTFTEVGKNFQWLRELPLQSDLIATSSARWGGFCFSATFHVYPPIPAISLPSQRERARLLTRRVKQLLVWGLGRENKIAAQVDLELFFLRLHELTHTAALMDPVAERQAMGQAPEAPVTKRGVEVSNKLDKDGTLVKGTTTSVHSFPGLVYFLVFWFFFLLFFWLGLFVIAEGRASVVNRRPSPLPPRSTPRYQTRRVYSSTILAVGGVG